MKITIPIMGGAALGVDADVTGEWAVHESVSFPDEWHVTHVPTGLKIPRDLTRKEADALASRLSRDMPILRAELPADRSRQPKIEDLGATFQADLPRLQAIVKEVLGW